jgi:hypothetical protein
LLDIGGNGPLTADYQACADERQEVFMKAYISIALVVPLFALCAACAEAPYASETRASKTARPASPALPARKPAIALADPPASAAVFIPSEARRQPSDAAATPSPPSGDGIPAASLSAMPSIAADGPKTEAAPQ